MSLTAKSLLALGLFTLFAACGQQEEPMEDTMVVEEETMSKF